MKEEEECKGISKEQFHIFFPGTKNRVNRVRFLNFKNKTKKQSYKIIPSKLKKNFFHKFCRIKFDDQA